MRSLTLAPYLNRASGRGRPLATLLACGLALVGAASASASPTAASTFIIRGGGNGHGIGMSQYGAYGYALHGKSYRFILTHYYQGTSIGKTNPNRTVRVLLATGSASFSGATAAGKTHLRSGYTYNVELAGGKSLKIVTLAGKQVGPRFSSPLTVTGPVPLQVTGLGTYRGALQFRPDGNGGVETENAVGLDGYVRGVVASEMPSSWSAQALDAQAIAARTYAITTGVGASGYTLYDDTRSQVYGGVAAETPQTNAAVAATRGQVVTYHGNPVVTYFFASSGGYTESIQNVWPGSTPEPWLHGVSDPYDGVGGNPFHRWSQHMSVASAARKLGRLVKGSLVGIVVTKHGVSPRILQAGVVGTRGRSTVSGDTLQGIFGLLTTYASFTTITTEASSGGLSGFVYPAQAGNKVWVQVQTGQGWHTISHVGASANGSYTANVPGSGTYRVQFQRLSGPSVAAR